MANIDPKKADALLKTVSKKIGIRPDTLKKQLEEGKFDAAMKNMGKSESQKFNMILNVLVDVFAYCSFDIIYRN